MDCAGFSGLGVGCSDCERGTLLKKEVIGLVSGLALAGDLAGDFLVGTALDRVGEAARVWDRVAFFSPCGAPVETPVSVPLLERAGGGVCESSASDSDETTIGFFRVARSLAIPPQIEGPGEDSNAE
jgi:hypothetical protein